MHMTVRRIGAGWHLGSSITRKYLSTKPVVLIHDATIYRTFPGPDDTSSSNAPIFTKLSFTLRDREAQDKDFWAVISPSSVSRTSFLQVVAGQHVSIPPTARAWPALTDIGVPPHQAIKYVGFDADRGSNVSGTNVRGAYLSARYESRREETDFSVRDYLLGNTQLNALEVDQSSIDHSSLHEVTAQLSLSPLLDMPVSNLSNGQTRRARIAKALMSKPKLLLLDGPFMGLDPSTVQKLSGVLKQLAMAGRPRLIISLRPEDGVPQWINQLLVIDEHNRVLAQDSKNTVLSMQQDDVHNIVKHVQGGSKLELSRDGHPRETPPLPHGEALIDMQGVKVAYGDKVVLGGWKQTIDGTEKPGLWWSLHRGQRCGIFGPNGSGKTTMLSLITSDHPQTYSLPIKLFGRSRLPQPGERGITLFELQGRMGHSSPEVHAFFPKQLSVRRVLESAWADAPLAKPRLDGPATQRVDAFLRWFTEELRAQRGRGSDSVASDLQWAEDIRFGGLSFSSQRLLLFLRAIVSSPDLVILDEAFSGMDEHVRDKALLFLSQGENVSAIVDGKAKPASGAPTFEGLSSQQALLVISHSMEDVPGCIREWICLPEPGEGLAPRTGTLRGPLELNAQGWNDIWAS